MFTGFILGFDLKWRDKIDENGKAFYHVTYSDVSIIENLVNLSLLFKISNFSEIVN